MEDLPARYVPKAAWRLTGREFLPRIDKHLRTTFQTDAEQIENVCSRSNWGNLNRTSFRTILTASLRL